MLPILHAGYDIIPPRPVAKILQKQERAFAMVRQGAKWNTIIFAEHEAVYTYVPGKPSESPLFRNGGPETLRAPLVPVHRGGSITFHGPGQLVSYFIFNLRNTGLGALDLNSLIDKSVIDLIARYEISGVPKPEHLPVQASGVWVRDGHGRHKKIASRGLRVVLSGTTGNITRFGCAINLATDLSWFDPIYPCGLDIEMTSVKNEVGEAPDTLSAAYIFTEIFYAHLESFSKEKRHSN